MTNSTFAALVGTIALAVLALLSEIPVEVTMAGGAGLAAIWWLLRREEQLS